MEGMREEKRESDGRGLNKSYLDFLLKSEREGFFFFFWRKRGKDLRWVKKPCMNV